MIAVTPGCSRNSFCTASRSSRWRMVTPGAQGAVTGYFSGSSVTTTTFLTPSPWIWRLIIAGSSGPSTGWPPVMATASLNRILKVMLTPAAMQARIARMPEWK